MLGWALSRPVVHGQVRCLPPQEAQDLDWGGPWPCSWCTPIQSPSGFYVSVGNHRFLFLNGKSWGSISQWEIMGFYFPMGNHSFEYLNGKSCVCTSEWEITGHQEIMGFFFTIMDFYFSMGNHLKNEKLKLSTARWGFFMNNLVYFFMDLTWKTELSKAKWGFSYYWKLLYTFSLEVTWKTETECSKVKFLTLLSIQFILMGLRIEKLKLSTVKWSFS